jgi:hypothetical protein
MNFLNSFWLKISSKLFCSQFPFLWFFSIFFLSFFLEFLNHKGLVGAKKSVPEQQPRGEVAHVFLVVVHVEINVRGARKQKGEVNGELVAAVLVDIVGGLVNGPQVKAEQVNAVSNKKHP